MLPQRPVHSRFLRLVAAGAVVAVPAACGGNSDADVFSAAEASAGDASTAATVATEAPATAPGTLAPATTAATTASPTTVPAAATGATFPPSGELVVDFTYAPSSSDGRVRNPYVAVWVEDVDGNYVSTVAVWYEQSNKGTRYLNDLRAWMTASGGQVVEASTGATRSPGTYSVVWDGTGLDGAKVAQGEYVLWVEAAREHGPYEITSAPLTIGTDGFSVTLPDDGELSALTATLTA